MHKFILCSIPYHYRFSLFHLSVSLFFRFVLQVLRERREKGGSHSPIKTDHHPSILRAQNHSYGSHPDLTYNMQGYPDGRASPYLATLPQSKTFTSFSKLPLPHERGKKVRVSQKHEVHRPGINTNYLRPLTPQMFPTSTSAHSFDSMRRREELAEKARLRPASAIEISSDGSERLERYHDLLRYQATSPTRQSVSTGSSDRSRRDMQVSLQKLLAETGHSIDGEIENEQDDGRQEDTYHKQFLATKERILRRGSGKDKKMSSDNQDRQPRHFSHGHYRDQVVDNGEDYGIYGEDDDIDNDGGNEVEHENVKPMTLLPQSHRPKIMVPKWRQNAPLQPPSYNSSVEILQKQTGYSSEENLAASLVQSLIDSPVNGDNKTGQQENFSSNTIPRKNLKRKEATGRRSPRNIQSVPLSVHANNEDSEHDLGQDNDVQTEIRLKNEDLPVSQTESDTIERKPNSETKERRGSGVSTALIDVIAYTADCLERSDSNKVSVSSSKGKTDLDSSGSSAIQNSSEDKQLISSPDTTQESSEPDNSEAVITPSLNSEQQASEGKPLLSSNTVNTSVAQSAIPFANMSKSSVQEKKNPTSNTDNLVYYFQNRKVSKSPTTEQTGVKQTNDLSGIMPNVYSKNITSTPTAEAKPFAFNPDTFNAKNNVGKKDRLVRADEPVQTKDRIDGTDKSGFRKDRDINLNQNHSMANEKMEEAVNKEKVLRAVDRLRMSFERPKTLAISNQNQTKGSYRPISVSADSTPQKQPLILKTFTLPQKEISGENNTGDQTVQSAGKEIDTSEHENAHRMYRKAGGLRSPTKHLGEAAATARQIQKLERSTSPLGKLHNPDGANFAPSDRSKSPIANFAQNVGGKVKRGTSPQRVSKEGSYIPQRSGSPVRSIGRPLSASSAEAAIDPLFMQNMQNGENSQAPLKSAMKDTKIPVLRKSGNAPGSNQLSKSTEDISKMKKKSAFKDSLKNIFGRKK